MTCHECKQSKMELPPRVIEIANEVAPALFFRKNIPASVGDESVISPESGDYRNVLLYYETNSHAYLIDSAGIATPISVEVYDMDAIIEDLENLGIEVKDIDNRLEALNDYVVEEVDNLRDNDANLQKEIEEEVADRKAADEAIKSETDTKLTELDNKITNEVGQKLDELDARVTGEIGNDIAELQSDLANETTARENGDNDLQEQIDAIESKSDVVDVVDTYADLESYSTASLGDNDVVKVLQDETHDGAISYYRWNKTAGTWSYVGSVGPYYTKAEVDEKIQESAGSDVKLYSEYSTATDGANTAKFIDSKLNNTNVVIGQNANASNKNGSPNIAIGRDAYANASSYGSGNYNQTIAIGYGARANYSVGTSATDHGIAIGGYSRGFNGLAIGSGAVATVGTSSSMVSGSPVAIGTDTSSTFPYSVALGAYSKTEREGEVAIGDSTQADSRYSARYLANVRAGEKDTDATNLAQVKQLIAESGGGGSVELAEEYGDSSTTALSQKFLSSVLSAPSVILGSNASGVNGDTGNIVIGSASSSTNDHGSDVVIGRAAKGAGLIGGGCVAIGNGANSTKDSAISVGYNAGANGAYCVAAGQSAIVTKKGGIAIGAHASAAYENSVALGYFAVTTRDDEVSIGGDATSAGAQKYRYLANVKAGELDTDAVNVKQLNDALGDIQSILVSINGA